MSKLDMESQTAQTTDPEETSVQHAQNKDPEKNSRTAANQRCSREETGRERRENAKTPGGREKKEPGERGQNAKQTSGLNLVIHGSIQRAKLCNRTIGTYT